MRKSAAVTVVILLLLLSFSGCGNEQQGNTGRTTQASQPVATATTPITSTPVTAPVPTPASGTGVVIEARFVDVGQGDCEILKIAEGSSTFFALVDTGEERGEVLQQARQLRAVERKGNAPSPGPGSPAPGSPPTR